MGLALLAIPAFFDTATLVFAGLLMLAAVVVGWLALTRGSAPYPALVGIVIGLTEIVVLVSIVLLYSSI